jgi:tetratricopeptide (TPR) repeat protein
VERLRIGTGEAGEAGDQVAAERALADHVRCYPPATVDSQQVLEPMYPDRLAEDFLALTLPGHLADYPQRPWAATTLATLLDRGRPDDPAPPWTARALTFLLAAAERWDHLGPGYVYPLLLGDPRLAIDGGNPVLAGLTRLPDVTPGVLNSVHRRLPRGRNHNLDMGAAAVTQRWAEQRLARARRPATRAAVLADLGRRLARAGLHDDALPAQRKVVEIWRAQRTLNLPARAMWRFLQVDPAGINDRLTRSLIDLTHTLIQAGEARQAVVTAQEADAVYDRLGESLVWLVTTRSPVPPRKEAARGEIRAVRAAAYWAAGRRGMAKIDAQSALMSRWRFKDLYLKRVDPRLAGLFTDHVPALEQAVAMAVIDPATGDTDMALSSVSLRTRLDAAADVAALHDPDGARPHRLSLAYAAYRVCERLAEIDPDRYLPDFAVAVDHLGELLSVLNHAALGEVFAARAVGMFRKATRASPSAYEPHLATALVNLSQSLRDSGRPHDARAAAEEAAEIRQRRDDGSFQAREDLAEALRVLADLASVCGEHEQAVETAREALAISRAAYTESLPAPPWTPENTPEPAWNVGRACLILGTVLVAGGQYQDALPVLQESIDIGRQWIVGEKVRRYRETLAKALNNQALAHRGLGQNEDAETTSRMCLDLAREEAASDPELFEPFLAHALTQRAITLMCCDRYHEASVTAVESVEIHRRLAQAKPVNPSARETGRAGVPDRLAALLLDLGRLPDALPVIAEALDRYTRPTATDPATAAFDAELARLRDDLTSPQAAADHERFRADGQAGRDGRGSARRTA